VLQRINESAMRAPLCGSDADDDVVTDSRVDGPVHAQLGDPAVERMPGAVWAGPSQEGVE
jgi:hypothetical protein